MLLIEGGTFNRKKTRECIRFERISGSMSSEEVHVLAGGELMLDAQDVEDEEHEEEAESELGAGEMGHT